MNENNRPNLSDNDSTLPAAVSKNRNLLETAYAELPADQRKALAAKAAERRLDVDTEAKKAELRYHTSSAEMANTIKQVQALENTTKSDYTVNAHYDTASGRTTVQVKKSNNLVIIVIAIVIGTIVLILVK